MDQQTEFENKLLGEGYQPLPDFAVIDECNFHDDKTGQDVHLDADRLREIADFHNRLIETRDQASVICLGHTKDKAKEADQPPVVGLATRWRVAPFKDGKAAIFVRPWAKPGHVDTFRNNPQRSSELWLDPDAINPIALLGSTTPRRDLGLHIFSRGDGNQAPVMFGDPVKTSGASVVRFAQTDVSGRRPILFEMRDTTMDSTVKCEEPGTPATDGAPPADGAGGDDETVQKVMNSDWGKKLSASLDKILAFVEKAAPIFEEIEAEATGAPGGPGAPPGGPPGAPPPGVGGPPPGGPADAAPPPPPPGPPGGASEPPMPDREDGPNKKNMAGSSGGYGNTFMPNHSFSRGYDETAIRLQRMEAENHQMRQQIESVVRENAALKMQRIEDEVDAALAQLKREGYTVVEAVDRPELCRLSREDRAKKIDFFKQTRAKKDVTPLPGGGGAVVKPEDQLIPVKFERVDTPGLPGDPNMKMSIPVGDDYASLERFVGESRRKNIPLAQAFDVSGMTAAEANGVKVR